MRSARHSYCKEIPLWKWTLLFIGGTVLFLVLYSCAQTAIMTDGEGALKMCISLAVAFLLIAAYILIVGKMEKRRTDELILPSAIAWTGKGLLIGIGYFSLITAILAASGMYSIDRTAALIVSSLLFGAIHIANPDASLWSSVAISIEAGLLLGAAYAFSGNLWLPIGIHWAWNFMEGNIFGFDVSGSAEEYSLLIPSISGPDILTGGGFGPEASIIAVASGAALSAWFIWRCNKSFNPVSE